ncbi:MAG: hypothetical protein HC914_21135 [Chloroflexaceae bacterium]|nr:hypothetical protein [Chloroflexaceae bacterium]
MGKREVRWLRERLIPVKQARETLKHIEVLLEPERYRENESAQLRRAQQARHPWRRQTGLHRKTRVSRAFQRSLDVQEPLVRLKTLNDEELLNLHAELGEIIEFASQFAAIREAVDIFLSPAPAQYPTVPMLLTDAEWREKWLKYDAYLESLSRDVFEEKQAEADETAQQFQVVASEIGRPALQRLTFKRPMRLGTATFALLYAVSPSDEAKLKRKYRRMKPERLEKKWLRSYRRGKSTPTCWPSSSMVKKRLHRKVQNSKMREQRMILLPL